MGTFNDREPRGPCPRCPAVPGGPCLSLRTTQVPAGEPILSIHVGRLKLHPRNPGRVRDEEIVERRLRAWKRGALDGVPVAIIAHQLGMKRAALDQFVVRERRNGNPLAVHHVRYARAV